MLKRLLTGMVVFGNLSLLLFGQSPVTLLQDTAVRIIVDSFSARKAQVGQQTEFRVAENVWSGNTVAIPRGSVVVGETVPVPKALFRRTEIWIKLLYIRTPSGEHIPVHIFRHGEADLRIDVVKKAVPGELVITAYVSRDMQLLAAQSPTLDHPGAAHPVSLRPIVSR